MAIIYSFPNLPFNELNVSDTLIINDTNNNDEITTRTVTLKNLADFVTSTGTGTGTTNAIIKWSDGPAGLLGDSIMTESATQIDLAGTFLSTSSPTATSGPVHAIRADQSTTTGGAFNIALYGDTKHTGATQANSNYGIYTKAEFEGTGGYTGIILGGSFEGRYDGSGTNGANASIYGAFSKANVTGTSSGNIQYMIASNVSSEMGSGTTTDVEFLQGQHTNVTLNSGNVSGDIAVNILDFDYTAGTLQGDFAYLQIQNDNIPTPVSGTARAINSDSTLPSHFSGVVEIPLIPTANDHATSKQYVDQQIASIPAGLVFQGNWNASTNTPALASGTGTVGNYYVVSVAGNTDLDGITDWEVGDWAVFVEVGGVDKWDKIDQTFVQGAGATGQVSFWNGINSVTGDNDLYWDNSNKRLGIGTTSPDTKTHIFGGSDSQENILLKVQSNGVANDGSLSTSILIANSTSETSIHGAKITAIRTGSGSDDLTFGLFNTNSIQERMRINSTGDVGIGTIPHTAGNTWRGFFVGSSASIISRQAAAGTDAMFSNNLYINSSNVDKRITTGGASRIFISQDVMRFQRSASDSVDTTISWSESMRIDDSGNVGIGTSSPSQILTVRKDSSATYSSGTTSQNTGDIVLQNNNQTVNNFNRISFQTNSDNNQTGDLLDAARITAIYPDHAGANPSGELAFETKANAGNMSEVMRIDKDGNVGIGTSSPSEKLTVQSSFTISASNSFVEINSGHEASGGSDVTGEAGLLFKQAGSGNVLRNAGSIVSGRESNYSTTNTADSYLAFSTAQNSVNAEKMRINSAGNVGIGTTNPLTKLHIAGTTDANIIRIENTVTALSAGNTIGAIQFFNNDTTDKSPNVAASIYATAGASGGSGSLRFKTTEPSAEGDPATDTMIITNGGNVGIGITSPPEKLSLPDNAKIGLGDSADLQIYHNASNSIVENFEGDLILKNSANDKDIIFQSDDGSGSTATYFLLDGSIGPGTGSVFTRFPDNSKAVFGTSSDLQIYHDGSDSYIDETGTGDLYIKAVDDIWMQSGANIMGRFNAQGVKLYHLNVSKLETISSGAKLPEPGDGITLVSPDGNTTRKISIDNSGNLVVA